MSGRWRSKSEGKLTGRVCGSWNAERSSSGRPASPGNLPMRTASWLRVCASAFSSGGRFARVCASCARCASTSERELLLDQLELALLRIGDLARRADLLAQRRLAERGRGDVPGQRKIGGLELKALEVYSRLQRLELAP